MTRALPLNGRISRTCRGLFGVHILCCNFIFIFFYFNFFGFHWKEKMLILNVEVYKLLCYNKTNVYTKDRMLFYQNRCSTWPSKFDLHNGVMSNFVSLTSYFLIRTLQDDLRAMQIELKGCESCLNVSVTGCMWVQFAAMDLYPWFLSQFGIF